MIRDFRFPVIILLFILIIVLAGLLVEKSKALSTVEQKYETIRTDQGRDNSQKEGAIVEQYKAYYSERLQKLLSDQELQLIAQKYWKYILMLNGEPVRNNTIYTKSDTASIVLAEINTGGDILPADILNKGAVTGNDSNDSLENHIIVSAGIPFESRLDRSDTGRRLVFDFKGIPRGTIISLKLSPMLEARLETIDNNTFGEKVEIIYR